jgi:hypothetical protein
VSTGTELRNAARGLDPERVVRALDQTFEAWRSPESPWRRRLASALELYSAEVLDEGIVRGLEHWNADALRAIRSREISGHVRPPELTAVWLAGSIPTAAFSAIALPLLAGSAVYARPASSDSFGPALFAASLTDADPTVGACVALGSDERLLDQADAVVAYGRDETLESVRARVSVTRIFVGYGHRISVVAVGREADLAFAAAQVARDVSLYDGRGCLSPAYVLVDDAPRGRARALAEALAEALEYLRGKLPRGRLQSGEEAALHELRATHAMSEATRAWLSRDGTDWGVLLGLEGIRPAPGLLRNVPVVPVTGSQGLARWCAGLAPHLSSLAAGGWPDSSGALARIALQGGASRLCPLGTLQLPRLEWRHDGRGAIEPLLRSLDVEPEAPR